MHGEKLSAKCGAPREILIEKRGDVWRGSLAVVSLKESRVTLIVGHDFRSHAAHFDITPDIARELAAQLIKKADEIEP